ALAMLSRFGIRSVFWSAAVPGALCVLVAWAGIREIKRDRKDSAESVAGKSGAQNNNVGPLASLSSGVKLPASFYYVLVAVTLFSLGNSSDMFLVLRAQNVGIRVALAPLLGLVFNITYTLGSWPAGWFSDHFSRRWLASAGALIFAGGYYIFFSASPPPARG